MAADQPTHTKLRHLGIIADGNRRWAREHNLPTIEGHKKGIDTIEALVEAAGAAGIEYITFYVFSTENWNRSDEEVGYIMHLVETKILDYVKKLAAKNARFIVLGSRRHLSDRVAQVLDAAEAMTANCTGITVCFCFNYGGEQEIAAAANAALSDLLASQNAAAKAESESKAEPESKAKSKPEPESKTKSEPSQRSASAKAPDSDSSSSRNSKSELSHFTPDLIRRHLYHPEIPDLDMIVRTSGEQRLSGFMLWRASYAELLFLDKYFPDLTKADIPKIITEFEGRHRRFGQ